MITSLLPAQPETRTCLRLHMRGLHPVYLVQCLFLLYSLLLCVAYSCAVVDEKRSHHWCDTPLKKYIPGGEGSGNGAVGGGIRKGDIVPLTEYMPGGEGSGDGAVGGGMRKADIVSLSGRWFSNM